MTPILTLGNGVHMGWQWIIGKHGVYGWLIGGNVKIDTLITFVEIFSSHLGDQGGSAACVFVNRFLEHFQERDLVISFSLLNYNFITFHFKGNSQTISDRL
jgi:hypothetical protein